MPGAVGQKHRGRGGRQHAQPWWNEPTRVKVVKEKMHSPAPATPPREDLDVSNEVALGQFWEINETGLRQLGVCKAGEIGCEVVKDSKGARFTFTLPITSMPTSTRHQLATSFKKAYYKHKKVLIIIDLRESGSQSPQRDIELLSNMGIETVSVVSYSPVRTPPPSRPADSEVFQYIPVEVREALIAAIHASDAHPGEICSGITLEMAHSILALTPEQAASAIKNTEPLLRTCPPADICTLLQTSITQHPAYTPPAKRTAVLTPVPDKSKIPAPVGISVPDVSSSLLAILLDITRQGGPVIQWCVDAQEAIIEFCSVEALERAKRVIRVCGQLATINESPASVCKLAHNSGVTLLDETRQQVVNRVQPVARTGQRAPLGAIKAMNPNIMLNTNTVVKTHTQAQAQVLPTQTPLQAPKALPPMPDLTPMSSNVSEVSLEESKADEAGLPPLYDLQPQVSPAPQPPAAPPATNNKLVSDLMTHAGVIRMQQQNQHLPMSPVLAEQAAAAGAIQQSSPVPPPAPAAPLCPVAPSVLPLDVTDRQGNTTTFNTMQTRDSMLLVWNGEKVGHTVVRKLALRLSVTGPELFVGTSRLELRWKGLKNFVMRLKEMCEKVQVHYDLECVAGSSYSEEQLEHMWCKATKIREVGTMRSVSYDPYAKSPQKDIAGYGKVPYEVPVVHNPSALALRAPSPPAMTSYVPMKVQVQREPPAAVQKQGKRLNVNATPFTPGQSPSANDSKQQQIAPVGVPSVSPKGASTSPAREAEQLSSKFDDPTPFKFKAIDVETHPVLDTPSLTAREVRRLRDEEIVEVTEVLAAGSLTWAKIGVNEWSLMGKGASLYLHMCM